jgi:hypothetical protein
VGPKRQGRGDSDGGDSVDVLLDQAVSAISRDGRVIATALPGEVSVVDRDNADAEDFLSAAPGHAGEIRRLTILFADFLLGANPGSLLLVVTGRPTGWLSDNWPVGYSTFRR